MKQHFARHGLCEKLVSDNGPPFGSAEFRAFAEKYEFEHVTSSPRYSQSNGKVESAVKTAKRLMKKASDAGTDPYLALLDWRNTPSATLKASPAQIMFGRRTRTLMPSTPQLLESYRAAETRENMQQAKIKQAEYYNRHVKAKPELQEGQTVRVNLNDKEWRKGEIEKVLPFRSYIIRTDDDSKYRRNRRHVRFSDEPPMIRDDSDNAANTPSSESPECDLLADAGRAQSRAAAAAATAAAAAAAAPLMPAEQQQPKTSRSGRAIKKPLRFRDD